MSKETEKFWIVFSIGLAILVFLILVTSGMEITGIRIHKGF